MIQKHNNINGRLYFDAHADALEVYAVDYRQQHGPGPDAELIACAARQVKAGDTIALKYTLSYADSWLRERICNFIHPYFWEHLGCPAINIAASVAAYEARFSMKETANDR